MSSHSFEVKTNRSVLAPSAIGQVILKDYEIDSILEIKLRAVGVNDHYLIHTTAGPLIFRLYQRGRFWALTAAEHDFELELLRYLFEHGLPVAHPLSTRHGTLLGTMAAPEGDRFYALFTSAPGNRNFPPGPGEAENLGRLVARFHATSNGFRSSHPRIHYDRQFMVSNPTANLAQYFDGTRREDVDFLKHLGQRLEQWLEQLPRTPTNYGLIGGDFNGTNHHVSEDGIITLFDFDFCGYGWRGYDLAMFCWSMEHVGAGLECSKAFFRGYADQNPGEINQEWIDGFMAIIQIFMMNYHLSCRSWAGTAFLNEAYWATGFSHLRAIEKRLTF